MSRRQTLPTRWMLVTEGNRRDVLAMARKLPLGSGILLLAAIPGAEMRRLRHLAAGRHLLVKQERRGIAARVHNVEELRRALSARTGLILLSPLYPTDTHPEWQAIPRMRAATLAQLAGRNLIALGGMNERRYAKVARLGFSGWAGLSAFRT